jgi:hypothetical protein
MNPADMKSMLGDPETLERVSPVERALEQRLAAGSGLSPG